MSTSRWVFVEVFQICHNFNYVNMRFVVKVIFFPIKFYKKIYFHGKFVTEFFYFFFYSHICSLGSWNYNAWMNKFLFTENNFLPRLMKQESCTSLYCIFHSVYALNTRSIELIRRIVVKVLIMLLIKQ